MIVAPPALVASLKPAAYVAVGHRLGIVGVLNGLSVAGDEVEKLRADLTIVG